MTGPWLGGDRGFLADWVTQRWVRLTGRRLRLPDHPWIQGPMGEPDGIGSEFYERLARENLLEVEHDAVAGLMPNFQILAAPAFDPATVRPEITRFYERTAQYRLDAWSQWHGFFRPFGWLLALIFSRRLQQLNIPLSPLATSRGLSSRIVSVVDPTTREKRHIGWVRVVTASHQVVYVGDYSTCVPPGFAGPCVRVVFPLPNGNATVILRPEAMPDGSLTLHSSGRRFGDPGFYFVVREARGSEHAWVRYMPTMRERIHVYLEHGELHTDHFFRIWGVPYLQLHYRMMLSDREEGEKRDQPI